MIILSSLSKTYFHFFQFILFTTFIKKKRSGPVNKLYHLRSLLQCKFCSQLHKFADMNIISTYFNTQNLICRGHKTEDHENVSVCKKGKLMSKYKIQKVPVLYIKGHHFYLSTCLEYISQ